MCNNFRSINNSDVGKTCIINKMYIHLHSQDLDNNVAATTKTTLPL